MQRGAYFAETRIRFEEELERSVSGIEIFGNEDNSQV